MYRTRFMILVLRCLLYIVKSFPYEQGCTPLEEDTRCLIEDLKQHGGE